MNHFQIKQKTNKQKTLQSPCVLYFARSCSLHAHVFFFFFFFFFVFLFHEKFLGIIYLINTVQRTQVFSFARSRFLVFPREMFLLYIFVRLMSNLFSFHSQKKR